MSEEVEGETLRCSECGRAHDTEDADELPDGRDQLECDCGNFLVECAHCGEFVSVMAAKSGKGGKPVHADHGVDGLV